MKIKHVLCGLTICAAIGLVAGCKKKETVTAPPPVDSTAMPGAAQPDSATGQQSAEDAAIFQRAMDRAKALVDQKDWAAATAQFTAFDTLKLTPEQKAAVDALKAKVPSTTKK